MIDCLVMPVPDILIRRTLPEEYTSTVDGKRYLDDEEITVLSILDQQGYISSTQQIQDFMIVITRLERKVILFSFDSPWNRVTLFIIGWV